MLSHILVALVAVQHVGFAVLEMVLWKTPTGRRIFALTVEQAEQSALLAMNQGLYNLFLAAGLVTSFFLPPAEARTFRLFFLACVLCAGIFGGITVKRTILFVQGLPAAAGLFALLL